MAFTIAILGRLFYLQVIRHDFYFKIASEQHWSKDYIPAERGKIYVKDEMTGGLYPLAQNRTLSLIYAAPEEMDDKSGVAQKIAPILKEEPVKIKDLLDKNHTYVVLKHQVSYEDLQKIKDANLKGIFWQDEQVRYYPEKTLASQVLGYVDSEGNGKYGLEQYFDDILSGTPGLLKSETDTENQRIAFGDNVLVPAKNGTDLVLTLNRDVQTEAEKIIKSSVEKFKAKNGSIIVMDPENGEIIAMANSPTFDPNTYKDVKNYDLFKNVAVTDEYEPGSIFKAMTMGAGLDTKKVQPDTKYDDKGFVTLNGNKIYNSTKKAHGWVNMTYVLEQSLNTGTVFILDKIGKAVFFDYLRRFGFGVMTGIEQVGEAAGRIFKPGEVNDHGYATMTFGQSISTTPVQMITAFAAIANGGKLVRPHLVAEKISPDGKKEVTDNRPIKEILSKETTAKETKMLVGVVEKGHGYEAKVKGYKVAGKTGTAQVPNVGKPGYDPYRNIGSFIGFGPVGSPRFVVLVKVDSPKGIPWAESSAAPAVGEMLDFLFKYYQIPPTESVK